MSELTQNVMATAIATNGQRKKAVSFMNMPPELRVKVYEHLLIVGKVFYKPLPDKVHESRLEDREKFEKPSLAILRICKVVHIEAEHVYLSNNMFVLPHLFLYQTPFYEKKPVPAGDYPVFSARAFDKVKELSIGFTKRPEMKPMLTPEHLAATRYNPFAKPKPITCLADIPRPIKLPCFHALAMDRAKTEHEEIFRMCGKFKQLQTLELDFTNYYCPYGCCRMVGACAQYIKALKPLKLRIMGLRRYEEVGRLLRFTNDITVIHSLLYKTAKRDYGLELVPAQPEWDERLLSSEEHMKTDEDGPKDVVSVWEGNKLTMSVVRRV